MVASRGAVVPARRPRPFEWRRRPSTVAVVGSLSRRAFLGGSAALAAAVAAGCTSGDGTGDATGTAATAATGALAAATDADLRGIDHVVLLMQENRSFDHYFGMRPGVRGYADADLVTLPSGKPVWYQPTDAHPDGYVLPWHLDGTAMRECVLGVGPDRAITLGAWHGGDMDRFLALQQPVAMGYLTRADLPYYWALADEFTVCDGYHCSVLSQTNPNRLYYMSGTIDPGGTKGGPELGNDGNRFRWTTYPERLQDAGVSWRVYHDVDDFDDNVLKFFARYQDAPRSSPLYDNAMRNRPIDAFLDDARAGNLPQVSWIVGPTAASEHPPSPPALGEDYSSRCIEAVMSNREAWAKTLLIFHYDEHGGFFDHVPPPVPQPGTADEFVDGEPIGLGLRVPAVIASPWSRGGRVVSDTFDHTSTLLLLERRFGVEVPNLSDWRREAVGDLTTTLDFSAPDPSVPSLPDTAARADSVSCTALPFPSPPTDQALPA